MSLHSSTVGAGHGGANDFAGYDVPLLKCMSKLMGKLPAGQEAVLPSCLKVRHSFSYSGAYSVGILMSIAEKLLALQQEMARNLVSAWLHQTRHFPALLGLLLL